MEVSSRSSSHGGRTGELEAFLAALFPDPDLLVRLYLAYVTTSASTGTGNRRLNLSVTGRAFEANLGRGWADKAGWRWEDENSMQWLDRRHRDATNMLHKVDLLGLEQSPGARAARRPRRAAA
jgi:hypothetical protein